MFLCFLTNHHSDSKGRTSSKSVHQRQKSVTSVEIPSLVSISKSAEPMRVKEKPRPVKKTKCVWNGYMSNLEMHLQRCKSHRSQTHKKSSESEIFYRQRKEYYADIEQQICAYSPIGCSYSSTEHSEYQKHLKKHMYKHLDMVRDHHSERITNLENVMNEKVCQICLYCLSYK